MKLGISVGIAMAVTASLMARQGPPAALAPAPESAKEVHLANVRQLTFGGENAEAYFSSDGQELIFQSMRDGGECDQIYAMRTDGSQVRRISSGEGRTTCSYFTPDKQHVVYASTYLGGKTCPPRPDFSRGYVWPVYNTYDIFKAKADGTGVTRLTSTPGYDAEATIGPTGRIVFTSVRDGDMEIYSMNGDGSDVRRLTNLPGPDGGPFFSADGSKIVFLYGLNPDGDLMIMDANGANRANLTSSDPLYYYGATSFSLDGQHIYATASTAQNGKRDIYRLDVNGANRIQITVTAADEAFLSVANLLR